MSAKLFFFSITKPCILFQVVLTISMSLGVHSSGAQDMDERNEMKQFIHKAGILLIKIKKTQHEQDMIIYKIYKI